MTTTVEPSDPAIELLNVAMVAKLARDLAAPRLAVRAARRTRELADTLLISLSPLLAATTGEAEDDRLADVRCTGQLAALLRPEPTEESA